MNNVSVSVKDFNDGCCMICGGKTPENWKSSGVVPYHIGNDMVLCKDCHEWLLGDTVTVKEYEIS